MLKLFSSLFFSLLFSPFLKECTEKQTPFSDYNQENNPFFPITKNSVWIYSIRNSETNILTTDTIKISQTSIMNNETVYKFSSNESYLLRGDSVYQIQRQRSGFAFPTLQFYPVKDTLKFRFLVGGDAFGTRTACLLKDSFEVNKNYIKNCIKFEDFNGNYFIIAPGIGFIEKKVSNKYYKLLDYKL